VRQNIHVPCTATDILTRKIPIIFTQECNFCSKIFKKKFNLERHIQMCQAKLIRRDGDVDVSDGVGMTFSRAYLVQPASFFCSSLGNVDYDCTSLSLSRNNFSRDIFFFLAIILSQRDRLYNVLQSGAVCIISSWGSLILQCLTHGKFVKMLGS